jgi:YD repeat-containing protein
MKRNPSAAFAVTMLTLFAGAGHSRADTIVNPSTEYLNRIKVAESVQPLGDTPFGESISLYTGVVSFKQTDISYPGIGPTITLSRSYEASGSPVTRSNDLPMADWDLAIPQISTVVPGNRMGYQGTWSVVTGPTSSQGRCTQFNEISSQPYAYGTSWWHGYQLITGDGGSQPLLKRTPSNTLAPGNNTAAYPIVTPGHWMVSCLPATGNGMPGEAFMALAPDGTKYWFNNLAYGPSIETLVEQIPWPNQPGIDSAMAPVDGGSGDGSTAVSAPTTETPNVYWGIDEIFLPRQTGHLYASRVEDRFGNWLTYTYGTGGRLNEINASDGRKVVLAWRTDSPLVDSITMQPGAANARTWRYEYSNPTDPWSRVLTRVVQPDQTAWAFAMQKAAQVKLPPPDAHGSCYLRTFTQIASDDNYASMSITHPGGLVGRFELALRAHARSWVPTSCAYSNGIGSPPLEHLPTVYLSLSLSKKTFSGPGVSPVDWTYQYSPAWGSTREECATYACREWQWVEVTDPEQQTVHYTYSTKWGHSEGKLLSTVAGVSERGLDNPTGLQVENVSYADPALAWTFPTILGQAMADSISFSNTAPTETLSPEVLHQTIRQGVTFSRQTLEFDRFGQSAKVDSFSTGGPVKTETITYWPVDGAWVLGQVWKVNQGTTLVAQTDYDTRILPLRIYNFGLLAATYAYAANGTLASIKDPLNNVTTLGEYYRGIPQRIQFADLSIVVPTADTFGQIASVKNQLGDTTSYVYDPMGRLTQLNYPAGDTVAWSPINQGFVRADVAAYGLPVGHWQQTVDTGNARNTTYYDAMWRPRLLVTEDRANAASKSFVIKRFDDNGREEFTGYPLGAITSVDDQVLGVRKSYDALGRVTLVSQDSELGALRTTSEYLDGFRTRITNPRNFSTTTSFQTFDAPSEASPKLIEAPEGLITTIERDLFGKPITIRREGPGGSP